MNEYMIKPGLLYTPVDIYKNGWVTNAKGKTSHLYVLGLIKSGKLKADRPGAGKKKYVVTGSELLKYIKKTYA